MLEWYRTEGTTYPPGAAWIDEQQTYNFTLYSRQAAAVTLLLYGSKELAVHPCSCL